jgi:hypothetical protein
MLRSGNPSGRTRARTCRTRTPLFDDLVNRLRVVGPRPPISDGSPPSSVAPRASPSRRRRRRAVEARARPRQSVLAGRP